MRNGPDHSNMQVCSLQNVLTSDGGAGKAGGGGGAGGSPGGVASPDSLKSDAMDDVLEILIRAGGESGRDGTFAELRQRVTNSVLRCEMQCNIFRKLLFMGSFF